MNYGEQALLQSPESKDQAKAGKACSQGRLWSRAEGPVWLVGGPGPTPGLEEHPQLGCVLVCSLTP